jgi:hypothetical protein
VSRVSEVESLVKEEVLIYLRIMYLNFPGKTEVNNESPYSG